jgi:hypothetical protein
MYGSKGKTKTTNTSTNTTSSTGRTGRTGGGTAPGILPEPSGGYVKICYLGHRNCERH